MDIPRIESLKSANAAFRLPAIPNLAARIAEMRGIAKTSKVERAIVVSRKTGEILWRSGDGDRECVDVSQAYAMGAVQGNFIMHTHPIPAELSLPDVICIGACEAFGNMAVCADGTLSWATTPRDVPFLGPQQLEAMADFARRIHGVNSIDEASPTFARDCACDNYWIADVVRRETQPFGFQWPTWYGEALIKTITGD